MNVCPRTASSAKTSTTAFAPQRKPLRGVEGALARLACVLCAAAWHAAPVHAAAGWCATSPVADARGAADGVLARAHSHLQDVPHPLAHLHTEGTLPHQGIYDASVQAQRDFALMRDAALAWRLSKDPLYAGQLERYLSAWMKVYTPDFNPIDETKLDGLIEAYVLADDALSIETREATQRFLRELAAGYLRRAENREDPSKPASSLTWVNNWQSHRVKLVTLAAAALQDGVLMAQAQALFLQQVNDNVRPDGSVEDFEDRDALHYVVYDLEPLTLAAIVSRSRGSEWLHARAANGATLASALDWLLPYAQGRRTHDEFAHTHVGFDRKRAAAGLSGFGGVWQPAGAATLYWQAASLDPAYRDTAQRLTTTPPDWLSLCTLP